MTIPMPEPVAHAVKAANTGKICSLYISGDDAEFSGVYLMKKERVEDLITTTQAEAYKDACVLEALTIEGAEAYAAARVREAQQWQPIDTAPRDGTWVLAVNAATNPGRQNVVHYSGRHGDHYPWVTSSAPMDFVAGVTHWMPLPAPPQ